MKIQLYYDQKDRTILFAAKEFSHYMNAAGCEVSCSAMPGSPAEASADFVPVHLAVDEAEASELDDFYQIDISTDGGIIYGSNPRSILLGIYACLREAGFRFLLPGKTWFPDLSQTDSFQVRISHHASLRHRGVCIEGADSLENVLDFIDWLPKVGFNSFFLQFKEPYIFLQRWYDHVFNPACEPASTTEAFYQDCYRQMTDAVKERSLLLHTAGHGWTCEVMGQPSIGWVKTTDQPDSELQKLIALVGGERGFIDSIPMNTNLCYSNPEAVDAFCNTVISYMEEHPHTDYLHIWLGDEPNHICECELCQKSNPTDQYIRILNKIDDRMTQKGLHCRLVFLLYQELLYPPVAEHLHHPEQFMLMFAPISRTFKKSYPAKIQAVPLPVYRRNQMTLPVTIEENLSYLKGWQDQFSGSPSKPDSIDYDYPLGRAHYGDFGYTSISRVLAGDIKHIHGLGLNGYMSCQELRAFLPNGLPNYVMGHLALDCNEFYDDIATEYCQAAYGKHYLKVLDYLTEVSSLSDCDYFNGIGPREDAAVSRRYSKLLTLLEQTAPWIKERLEEMQSCTADVQTGNQELYVFFWKLLDYHAEYGVRLTKALIARSAGDIQTAQDCYQEFCSFIQNHETSFQPYLDVYRIIEVSGKYTGLSCTS